jgi:aminoglycoside phosphotransferase family enzyme
MSLAISLATVPAPTMLAAELAWLGSAASYSPSPPRVERIETHFAYVFLAGGDAYKLKKPVRVHGADLRELAERERRCHEEVRINLRLAADTYLGVVPLVQHGDGFALGGQGTIVDWLVHMRRLDLAQMLDARLAAGTVSLADLEAVVAHLRTLDPCVSASSAATPHPGVAYRLEEALHEIARPEFGLEGPVYLPLSGTLRAAYADLRPDLAARAARVRDGHGDLRAEHIWLGPRLQIIDALEFDGGLRFLDPAEDIAMLAVDTERLAGSWTRHALIAAYERIASDPIPDRVWRFYLALRAATRAKVALWHLEDPTAKPQSAHWQTRAREYLACAARFLAGD